MSPTIPVAAIPVAALRADARQADALRADALRADAPAAEADRFIVGQDPEGHWVAVETHGRAGGLFRSRADALAYAEGETGRRPDAVRVSGARIALRL